MRVLVLGSDGRAHALAWKLYNSSRVHEVFCAPGNGGTSQITPQVDLDPTDAPTVARWAYEHQIDLIIPADNHSLAAGLADEAVALGVNVFGPPQHAAELEQSRVRCKDFLLRHSLPTLRGKGFFELGQAEKFLAAQPLPVLIRSDDAAIPFTGVFDDRYAALQALRELTAPNPQGKPGGVIIEEVVPSTRIVLSAFTDGKTVVPLSPVLLHDHRDESDEGPQVGVMGAWSTPSLYMRKYAEYMNQYFYPPLMEAFAKDQIPCWGVISLDCLITDQGPRILDIGWTFRDGEAQVLLPRMQDDLMDWIQATLARRLDRALAPKWSEESSIGIMLVTSGYPYQDPGGGALDGTLNLEDGVLLFHDQTHNSAGLRFETNERRGGLGALLGFGGGGNNGPALTINGGHVAMVVVRGITLAGARGRALINAERVRFPGREFRSDIGAKAFP